MSQADLLGEQASMRSPADATYRMIAWRIMPILFAGFILNFLDRSNIAFAKLHMQSDLSLSDTVYGLGAGIFFIGYFVFEVPSNLLLHRLGARLWIARIMVSWGLLSGAMFLIIGPYSFYLVRFLLGLAEAGFVPGVLLYLTFWFPQARRARIVALFYAAVPISGIIGGPLAGLILSATPVQGALAGWQWLFIVEAIPTMLLGLVVYFTMDDTPQQAQWLSADQKHLVVEQLDGRLPEEESRAFAPLADPRVWLLIGVFFGQTMGIIGFSLWLPTLVQASGVHDVLLIGLLSAVPYLCAVPLMILNSRHSDKRGERRWHVAVPMLLATAGLLLSIAASANPPVALLGLTMTAVGILSATPVFWTLPAMFLRGKGAASGFALINAAGNLGGFVGPFFVGYMRDITHSTAPGLLAMAAFLAIGGLLVLAVPQSRAGVAP